MAETDGSDFTSAYEAVRSDPDIQFELAAYQPPEVPSWLRALGPFLEWLAPLLPYIFGVLGLALLAYFFWPVLVQEYLTRRRNRADRGAADLLPTPEAARALLAEADALAAEGRYGEAARLLLYRSIEDMEAHDAELVRPALTSREIAGHALMPAAARDVFAGIAAVVERAFFARRPVAQDDWSAIRSDYDEFVFARPQGVRA